MSFMYLSLWTDKEGKAVAKLQNHGALQFSSLGGPNSRRTDHPFAVFQIDTFQGIEALDDGELVKELLRRFTTKEILQRLQIHLTSDEILRLLSDRLKGRAGQ